MGLIFTGLFGLFIFFFALLRFTEFTIKSVIPIQRLIPKEVKIIPICSSVEKLESDDCANGFTKYCESKLLKANFPSE